ncbi:hypothetical protein L596_012805 [Steinernema carpocapsae]|uniref:Uncharacterized protein n=1 Tax=Steinernema carpocapsae TaxID=34508 RepID=A0A4U5NYB7_STECR|nr:hypothetical protein L596_012805 [Steinernema carpocapsae]
MEACLEIAERSHFKLTNNAKPTNRSAISRHASIPLSGLGFFGPHTLPVWLNDCSDALIPLRRLILPETNRFCLDTRLNWIHMRKFLLNYDRKPLKSKNQFPYNRTQAAWVKATNPNH